MVAKKQVSGPLDAVLERLTDAKKEGKEYKARCPAHDDRNASLSISEGDDGRVLLHCFTGCDPEKVVAALNMEMRDLFPASMGGGGSLSPPSTLQPRNASSEANNLGCTLEDYATFKQLPIEELRSYGLTEITYDGVPAVRIPYRHANGDAGPIRFRTALHKPQGRDDRFKWKNGHKPILYGLWRLDKPEYAALVEGESCCHTLWHHSIPALGIPGASNWNEQRDAPYLDGIATIYAVIEPDAGGEAMLKWLAQSRIRERVYVVRLDGFKDASEMHVDDPEGFTERWEAAIAAAVPLMEEIEREAEEIAAAAWEMCEELAQKRDILATFVEQVRQAGLVGEDRNAKLLYLALTSRFLDRPISVAVKGPSSGGKSYTVESVLRFFPPDAYHALTAMSERALAYSEEPLAHRFLVVYEAAGMAGEMASYLMRSLLSEGRLRYETVEKTKDGIRPRLIEREGPTGLMVTTTATRLHPENETRLISLAVADTPEQTRAILAALAGAERRAVDYGPWHALQTWLACVEHRVTIPYGKALAAAIPPIATRLRRDFTALLNIISAHAILHQATRDRDTDGQVIATVDDYAAVCALVADLFAEGVEATVPPAVRQTVAAVKEIGKSVASVSEIAAKLHIDRSAASRRVKAAIDRGYLKDLEERRGRPAQITLGDPLPVDQVLLPSPDSLRDGKHCTNEVVTEWIDAPSPPAPWGNADEQPMAGREDIFFDDAEAAG